MFRRAGRGRGEERGEEGPGGKVHVVDIEGGERGVEVTCQDDEGFVEQWEDQAFQLGAGALSSINGE